MVGRAHIWRSLVGQIVRGFEMSHNKRSTFIGQIVTGVWLYREWVLRVIQRLQFISLPRTLAVGPQALGVGPT